MKKKGNQRRTKLLRKSVGGCVFNYDMKGISEAALSFQTETFLKRMEEMLTPKKRKPGRKPKNMPNLTKEEMLNEVFRVIEKEAERIGEPDWDELFSYGEQAFDDLECLDNTQIDELDK
jgi:hypothetical protein